MGKMDIEKLEQLGKQASLMPALPNAKAEERATSCLLASFMVVPSFAKSALSSAGAPSGKRFRTNCRTEVTFYADDEDEKKSRPDGLIVATNGSTQWTALIESKIGAALLDKEQVERYLDIAKANGIDAVITISNQYTPNPKHHPLVVAKAKLRSVDLFHFSWHSLIAKAVIVSTDRQFDDPEQTVILNDLIGYLDNPISGVSTFNALHSDWKEVCLLVNQHTPLNKNSKQVHNVVASWQELLRSSAIKLSREIRLPVEVSLSTEQKTDSDKLFADMTTELTTKNCFINEFVVPNAASKIRLIGDLSTRSILVSMSLSAPRDVSRSSAAINWLTRQLKRVDPQGITIRAHWGNRKPMTAKDLSDVIDNPDCLIPKGVKELPKSLEVVKIIDLAAKFKSSKAMAEGVSNNLVLFYSSVGQNLTAWVAKAPKVKSSIGPVIEAVVGIEEVNVEGSRSDISIEQ